MRKYITRPKIGDTRIVSDFILFPYTLRDQPGKDGKLVKRWCEKVSILQTYHAGVGQDAHPWWSDSSWADLK